MTISPGATLQFVRTPREPPFLFRIPVVIDTSIDIPGRSG
jgi:hypothetical protein